MRNLSIILMSLVSICALTTVASAQESYYIRQNRVKYNQARAIAAGAVRNVQVVQSALSSQRARFNQGMASTNSYVRAGAKREFLSYMNRLVGAYRAAVNAYNPVTYWGGKYATGLKQIQRTSAFGRQVAIEVQTLRNQQINLSSTCRGLEGEARTAARRR
jgi:hypothetical protein